MHINSVKDITFSDTARNNLAIGVKKLTEAVEVTMGPKGRHVLLEQELSAPVLTKDGVSVAQEIELENPIENLGAQIVKEAASNTAKEAGDGTTTSTVLANAIFLEGLRHITAGANPVQVKRGMDKAFISVLDNLKLNSKQITSKKEIEQVATISANSESSIGKMIADAMDKVGNDGIITVEEAKGFEDSLDVVQGMHFDTGYMSPYFITDTSKMIAELKDPAILVIPEMLNALSDIVSVLAPLQDTKKSLLIITKEVSEDALNTAVLNRVKGILDITVVRAPGYGDAANKYIEDIAISVGATLPAVDKKLKDLTLADLGQAEKIIISKDRTIIQNGQGTSDKVDKRVTGIRTELKNTKSDYEKIILQDRLTKLVGGVAVIKVGAATETEMREKKDRIDDALGATKAAVEEGIIEGGGIALLRASEFTVDLKGDENIGAEIVRKGLLAPIKQITKNAGYDSGVIINSAQVNQIGFDASTGEYVDMYQAGIIDSLKVARVALSNAISVAGMLLTTEAVVSIKKK